MAQHAPSNRLASSTPALSTKEDSGHEVSAVGSGSLAVVDSSGGSSCVDDSSSWQALATQTLRHSMSVPAFNLIVDPWMIWGKVIPGLFKNLVMI